ncbi:MAG: cytochrome c oxidase subunit 3 [Ulvibacter sp.]|jgi:cytochrome c oxidase subunit 3
MRADVIATGYSPERVIKAKKMLLRGSMLSIVMLFASLVSAYVVTKGGASYWVNITLPNSFWISTVLILLSSLTSFLAVKAGSKNKLTRVRLFLILTFALGVGFAVSQYQGFITLSERGLSLTGNYLENLNGEYGVDYHITDHNQTLVPFVDGHYIDPDDPTGSKIIDNKITELHNPASTYLIFIIGLHVLHIAGGLIYLFFLVIYSYFGRIERFNYLKVSQIATYWHFVDLLWILLLLFLYFIH